MIEPRDSTPLSDVVAAIAKRFVLIDGHPQMSLDDLELSCVEIQAVKQAQRQKIAVELVALGLQYKEGAGAAAVEKALVQLLMLTTLLLRDFVEAKELFEKQGIDLSNSAKIIDAAISKRPVGTSPLTQGKNLFSLLRDK